MYPSGTGGPEWPTKEPDVNSFVNVQVRILAAQAQRQLDALDRRIAGLESSFGKASRGAGGLTNSLVGMNLAAFGSRIQWIGRQIEYNFTLPLVAAAGASFKFALDNEAAFTRVVKVYGDAAHGADFYSQEIVALRKNFEALSNEFGVNEAATINIAAAWAAAGSSGIALAKSVELTLKTMVLGELEAVDATKALIAIQAQYGLQTSELAKVIDVLNMVENETATSLAGLIEGFAKAAGVARTAGVDYRHLAAMISAITPAAGTASQAGNALKTIFSKLLSPTRDVTQVLALMGIHIGDLSWKSADMTDKLTILAKHFETLSDAQKGVVATTIAGAWQVNRFSVLMRELSSSTGYYAKSLKVTEDATAVFAQAQKELNTVLTSNPRRLQIIWTMLQNAAADIIQPMIPLLLYLAQSVQHLVQWFSNLNPAVQKLILSLAAMVALIGPLIRIGGAFLLLVAELGKFFTFLFGPISAILGLFTTIIKVPIVGFFKLLSVGIRTAASSAALLAPAVQASVRATIGILAVAGRVIPATYFIATTAIVYGLNVFVATSSQLWYLSTRLASYAISQGGALITRAYWAVVMGVYALMTRGTVLIAGAWRAMLALITALTVNWRGTIIAIFTGLMTFFRALIPTMRAIGIAIGTALTGPWGLAIGAVIIIVMAFWKQIKQVFGAIVDGVVASWNKLPQGVRNALLAVVRLVNTAAKKVYEAMQWMNPWARHSPSLVENVTTGMAAVAAQFDVANEIAKIFAKAGITLEQFGMMVAKLKREADLRDIADQRKNLVALGSDSIPYFDKLVKVLFPLKDLLAQIGAEVEKQQTVVDGWKDKLDDANAALDTQQKILDQLKDVAGSYKDQLDKAQQELDRFANAPIQGMKAMNDAIFDNEMQAKAARLQLMQMEDALGPLDKLQGKIDGINGELELLQGKQANLRNAGAGSDILSFYDDQINALQDSKDAIIDQVKPLQDLSDEIDELGRKAEELDLQKSLQFDPLIKQINDVTNAMQELPFDEILAGVTANKAEVDRLTEAYNQANAAVEQQQAVVDALQTQRDAIQASYDLEVNKLQELQKEYDQVEDKIRAIEDALKAVADAAQSASKGMSPSASNFLAGAGGDFPDVGGLGGLGREGGLADQSKMIDDFTKEIADKTKNMFGMFDFLEPIKKGWNATTKWIGDNIVPFFATLFSTIGGKLGGMGNPFEKFQTWVSFFKGVWDGIVDAAKVVWEVIGPEIVNAGKEIWAALQDAFKTIQPEIEKFKDLIGPIGQALKNLWEFSKPGMMIFLGLLLLIIKVVLRVFTGVIGPVIRAIGDLIGGVIRIIRGIIEFVVGVFTGDWSRAWQGIVDIFGGIWDAVWGILSGAFKAIWGAVKGLVTGIVDFFVWLWDKLVGHSIVPDIVNGIRQWFEILLDAAKIIFTQIGDAIMWVWLHVIKPVFDFWGAAIQALKTIWNVAVAAIKILWNDVTNAVKTAWSKIGDYINLIKGIFTSLKQHFIDGVTVIKTWIDKLVGWFLDMKNRFSFSGLFDGLKNAFKSAVNWIISKWNNLSFTIGGGSFLGQNFPSMTISTPNLPMLQRGGLVANQAMAIVGEGRKGYPEYVIPTDPMFRDRALALFANLAHLLGVGRALKGQQIFDALNKVPGFNHGATAQFFAKGGILGRSGVRGSIKRGGAVLIAPHSESKTINFYGDLEFPNVHDGTDVEEFLRNLEALVSEV